MKRVTKDRALKDFIEAINATGGVEFSGRGECAPVADPDWIDLGSAYLAACAAIGVSPKRD